MKITDVELARLMLRVWRPEPGQYDAPAAVATWDGKGLELRPTGAALDPAAAVIAPALGLMLARAGAGAGAVAGAGLVPAPQEPAIAALLADYEAATSPMAGSGGVAGEAVFSGRLAACRACRLWRETARRGLPRCESIACQCSKRLLWLAAETCPEGRWSGA